MKISSLGEIKLIDKIRSQVKLFSNDIIKGIGDDAAVLEYNSKYYMLLTTDTLVEDDHFSVRWFKPEQIGSKAIESNISDIAAMGGIPKYALVSITLTKNLEVDFFDKLYKGIAKKCEKYRISIIGGNLSSGKKISIIISLIGVVEKKNLCLRSDAKVNDLILVTGTLGNSRSGLELLKHNKCGKSIDYYLNPTSKLKESRLLVKNKINAMEDVSDGLASEVLNICNASKKGAVIYKDLIPLEKNTIIDAKKVKKDPYNYALYGGEDYELVFTINKKELDSLNKLKNKLKFSVVGKILPKNKGVYLLDKDKKIKLNYGYEHFRRS
jgi:thiamine-monophosphate kinase